MGWRVLCLGQFGSTQTVFDSTHWRGSLFLGLWDYLCRLSSETVALSSPMRLPQSTWSPFQSPEVRDICANVTPAEHARLIDDARQRGADGGRWFADPFSIAIFFLLFSWQSGLVALVLFAIYFVGRSWPRLRDSRRKTIEMLCETEWARKHGYTPQNLRLTKFPWSA